MTEFSHFGVDVPGADDDEPVSETAPSGAPHRHESFPNGRCKAINRDGTRCSADSGMSSDLCHPHAVQPDPVTIDSDPRRLIEATARTRWRNVENEAVRQAVAAVTGGEPADG